MSSPIGIWGVGGMAARSAHIFYADERIAVQSRLRRPVTASRSTAVSAGDPGVNTPTPVLYVLVSSPHGPRARLPDPKCSTPTTPVSPTPRCTSIPPLLQLARDKGSGPVLFHVQLGCIDGQGGNDLASSPRDWFTRRQCATPSLARSGHARLKILNSPGSVRELTG